MIFQEESFVMNILVDKNYKMMKQYQYLMDINKKYDIKKNKNKIDKNKNIIIIFFYYTILYILQQYIVLSF